MLGAASRRAIAAAAATPARRTLALSPRRFAQTPNPTPGTPVTAQAVKSELHKTTLPAKTVQPAVREKVQEQNEAPQNKKRFLVVGLVLKALLYSSVLYGATLYVATKNDKVMDFVIDKQLPYYEELIEVIEKGSLDDVKRAFEKLRAKVALPSKDQIGEFTHKIEEKSDKLYQQTKQKLAHKTAETPLPAEQLQKPVEVEPVHGKVEKLPMVTLKDGAAGFADESVKATIASFNELIAVVDGANIGPAKDAMVKKISENITALSAKLSTLNTQFEKELQNKLKSSHTDLLSLYTQKELDLTQNMLDQYNYEKTQLEKKYRVKLEKEVEATRKALSQAAVNATSMVRVEQTKRFEKMIKERIDQERDGRLQNLDAVNARLEELEAFALSLSKQITATSSKSLIQHSLANLRSLMFSTAEDAPTKSFAPYVENLEAATSKTDDEVIALALGEMAPLLKHESSQSILTVPQLLTAWEQLTPKLRSASLLPPNAGLLGHIASVVFSKLLLPVKGAKPHGKDIESVIGRVEQSLVRGELDSAVEEVANLKGWTRKLADDWVREGRKRLEAEFLVDLITAETKIM